MTKQKEFKKICENWDFWLNEQKVGDRVDPDDQTSGYMRTKSGDVEKVASMPRDDGQSYSKADVDPDSAGNVKLAKQQKDRGMNYFKSAEQFHDYANILGEEWNGNPVTSFLFKIPGQKGAGNYSWGNMAVDIAMTALGFLPATHALGFIARGGNKIRKAFAAKVAAGTISTKGKAVAFASLRAAAAKGGSEAVVATPTKKIIHGVVDQLEQGKKGVIPFDKTLASTMIKVAKKQNKEKELRRDKAFMQALTALKAT